MTETVLLSTDGAIATVTLNRPESMNALDGAMVEELHANLVRVEQDAAIRCVVLRGAGDNFMAGGDIRMFAKALAELPPADRQAKFESLIGQVHASITALRRIRAALRCRPCRPFRAARARILQAGMVQQGADRHVQAVAVLGVQIGIAQQNQRRLWRL